MQPSPSRRPPPPLPKASNARRGFAEQQMHPQQWDDQWDDIIQQPAAAHDREPPETMALRAEEAVLAAQLAQMDASPATILTSGAIYQRPGVGQRSQHHAAETAPLAQQRTVSVPRVRHDETDTNAVLATSYLLLMVVGSMLKSRVAVVAVQLLCFAGVVSMLLLYAQVVPSTEPERNALWLWWFQASCYSTGTAILAAIMPSIRRALLASEDGSLNQLGLNTAMISVADKKYVDRWAIVCSFGALCCIPGGVRFILIPLMYPDREVFLDAFTPERP